MASSKVMPSRSPPNADRPRPQQGSTSPAAINLQGDHSRGLGSMSMDDLFRNIYPDSDSFGLETNGQEGAGGGGGGSGSGLGSGSGSGSSAAEVGGLRNGTAGKTVDEVWRYISSGPPSGSGEPGMTLEDFLAKTGAVNEEDVRVPAVVTMPAPPPPTTAAFGIETAMMNPAQGIPAVQFPPAICVQNGYGVEFGNGMAAAAAGGGGSSNGGSRGKRRAAVEEAPLDKATQQKQRRMIKNRESAARSRERKQAYTVELESSVVQLEKDHSKLMKQEAQMKRERYKQIMKNIIPIVEKRRPRKLLRRTGSMEW